MIQVQINMESAIVLRYWTLVLDGNCILLMEFFDRDQDMRKGVDMRTLSMEIICDFRIYGRANILLLFAGGLSHPV